MWDDDYDSYFGPEFRTELYNQYMQHSRHRLVHFDENTDTSPMSREFTSSRKLLNLQIYVIGFKNQIMIFI